MHKKLQKYIDSYTLIQNSSFTILPSGGMTLVYNLGASIKLSYDNNDLTLETCKFVLINVLEDPLFIDKQENMNLLFINFKGAGSAFFFDFSMDDLPVFIDVWVQREVSFDIKESDKSFQKSLDSFLLEQYNIPKSTFSILKILALIHEQQGEYDIDEVLLHADIPRKIFDKKFRAFVGLPLKTYAQIIKNSNA